MAHEIGPPWSTFQQYSDLTYGNMEQATFGRFRHK